MRTDVTRSLEGRTALVAGGGSSIGRAVALALSARGVRIVVTGRDEKALGETVGEIVHGGGKARHVVGEGRASAVLARADERAKEVFGPLDIVIDAELTDVEYMFEEAVPRLRPAGRVVLVSAGRTPQTSQASMARVVRDRARALPEAATCNAIVIANLAPGDDGDDASGDVGELVVFLCGRAAARITGQSIALEAGA
jgi:NAD(P)-dependent dehydrogenase (short-subunit alcohol dehydrogenase family)